MATAKQGSRELSTGSSSNTRILCGFHQQQVDGSMPTKRFMKLEQLTKLAPVN